VRNVVGFVSGKCEEMTTITKAGRLLVSNPLAKFNKNYTNLNSA
jgi:hypothetical protein